MLVCMLTITNELGQKIDITNLVLEKGSNELTINTSGFASGVYYITIISEVSVYPVKSFVISR